MKSMRDSGNYLILLILVAFILIVASFLVRLLGFAITGNIALGMETVHIISDFVLTLFVLIVIKITRSKFGRGFSFGLFKLEDLFSFFIAIIILFIGIEFLISGIKSLSHASFVASIYQFFSTIPLFIAGYLKLKAGRMIHSNPLKADGKHTYTDVYEGLGVALGLLAYSITNLRIFYFIAIFLAFAVLTVTGVSIAKDSLLSLLDLPKDKKIKNKIDRIVRGIEQVKKVKRTRIRWSGPIIFVELVVEMNPLMTIDEAHPVTEIIEKRIKEKLEEVYSVVVHIEPVGRKKFKILVPITEKNINSNISNVLAKSRYFAIVQTNKKYKRIYYVENPIIKLKEHVAPAFKEFLIKNKITDLICKEIGDSVYGLLLTYDIFCWYAKSSTLLENIKLFKENKLEKMKKHLVKKH